MGMNYYHVTSPAEGVTVKRHIGKSSAGWLFGLHVYPAESLNNIDDWCRLLVDGRVEDEEGNCVDVAEFFSLVVGGCGDSMVGKGWCARTATASWDLVDGDFY